jgi:CheY-like chemotaxis protein
MKDKLMCILFIDDDEPTNFLNKLIVDEMCCAEHVQIVHSGREALEYLTQSGAYKNDNNSYPRPDLIFLDINMPGMDGWEFLDHYKNLPNNQKGDVVMVMLTTSLNPDDEEAAKQYIEISGFENKPLQPEVIQKILNEFFAKQLK